MGQRIYYIEASYINWSNKYILNTDYTLDFVPGTEDTKMEDTSCLWSTQYEGDR